jgi:omega-amidase
MKDDSKDDLLQVSLVQFDISWKDPQGNLRRINQLIEGITTDLIVLPEMFATGFIDDPNQTDLGGDRLFY